MKKKLIQGTVILTAAGLFCRLLGFFYRIFLSQTIGAEGMGIYQLIFPIYNLCFALAVAGVQTALSRMISAKLAKKESSQAREIFLAGLFLCTFVSIILTICLKVFSESISVYFLEEMRCLPLLQMMALSLPLSTVHACINGYFFARKDTRVPAGLQVAEQIIRMSASYAAFLFFTGHNYALTPMIAVLGLVTSEFVVTLMAVFILLFRLRKEPCGPFGPRSVAGHLGEILRFSFPLTLNRVLLNLLHSVEAILIPWSLRRYPPTADNALGTFGVLTGMALPMILFPTAITNSMATVLLPTVAEEQAMGNRSAIQKLLRNTGLFSLVMGCFFAVCFYIGGPFAGQILFHSEEAGAYIRALSFICPFLYINTTLSSVINGLGKTFACFLINLVNLGIRILFVLLLIPVLGIWGYLYGLLAGEILSTILSAAAARYFLIKITVDK